MATKVLIIDDDEKLNDLLRRYFLTENLEPVSALTPDAGILLLKSQSPDVVILDVMLPTRSGFDVCREIRQSSSVPIIMLTARTSIADRIVGLKLGADDYVLKPVDPGELVARIETVLRRFRTQAPKNVNLFKFQGLEVDMSRRSIRLDDQELELSTMEFALLELFVRSAGRTLSRDELLDSLRGIEWESINRSIDVTISRLRQKLKDDIKNPRFLKTIRGSGYLFIGIPAAEKKAS